VVMGLLSLGLLTHLDSANSHSVSAVSMGLISFLYSIVRGSPSKSLRIAL
jgi:hypothetical protein